MGDFGVGDAVLDLSGHEAVGERFCCFFRIGLCGSFFGEFVEISMDFAAGFLHEAGDGVEEPWETVEPWKGLHEELAGDDEVDAFHEIESSLGDIVVHFVNASTPADERSGGDGVALDGHDIVVRAFEKISQQYLPLVALELAIFANSLRTHYAVLRNGPVSYKESA